MFSVLEASRTISRTRKNNNNGLSNEKVHCRKVSATFSRSLKCRNLVARAIRNAIRANRFARIIRNWNPYFYSTSGRFARITRISDIRANRANRFARITPLSAGNSRESAKLQLFRGPFSQMRKTHFGPTLNTCISRCMAGSAKKSSFLAIFCSSACARLLVHVRCPLNNEGGWTHTPLITVKIYGLHIKFSHREGLATDKGPSERATDQPGNYIAIT